MTACPKWLNYDSEHQIQRQFWRGIKRSSNVVMYVTGGWEVDEMSNSFC
jgi:hypothetical protein